MGAHGGPGHAPLLRTAAVSAPRPASAAGAGSAPRARRAAGAAAWARLIRLLAGLTVLTFLVTHLLNHALGLVSLAAMETARPWFLALWRNPVGTGLLYTALVIHPLLALWALYTRRRLRMPPPEALRVLLGLSIPPLLAGHVVGTRLAHAWFGVEDAYTLVLLRLWEIRPDLGLRQSGLLVIAWLHGCLGLHLWLRLRPWYPRAAPWLLSAAVLLPALALLGFVSGGRAAAVRAREAGGAAAIEAAHRAASPAQRAALGSAANRILVAYWTLVGGVLLARGGRRLAERRRGRVQVTYPGPRPVAVPLGFSVLDASRAGGIAHAAVCGGRGRCSTCRVRIDRGLGELPAVSPQEARVLARVGAPPNVRLACQVRPRRDVAVTPLLPAASRPSDGFAALPHHAGAEQEVTVLFADLRGFTRLAEPKFPYDVVFLLNRYFEVVGEAIERAGGIANQFTGDGVMALFGVGSAPGDGCRAAVRAARDMLRGVAGLSRTLADELPGPLQLGIGIHTGPAVVGRMGYRDTVYLTAVGDTVHVASRLQDLTKQYGGPLIVSEAVAARAGLDTSRYVRHELPVRNRAEPVAIRVIDDVESLAAAAERSLT